MKVTYNDDFRIAYFDGYKFRKDLKTGYYLSTKSTDKGKRERLHVYVWRFYNGEIPDGYHVHHVDENKEHNDIENLALLQKGAHIALHGSERWAKEPEKMLDNLLCKASPAAAEWHGSTEGKQWHSKHAIETISNLEKKEYTCSYCGKRYYSLPVGGEKKFCSNACKSAARRKSGVDNEKRVCVVCGEEFYAGKYTRTKTCSRACGVKLRQDKKNNAARATASLQHGS